MLKAEEYYDKYLSYDRRALHLSKYYLSRWAKTERNAAQLNETQKEIAFLLFSTLKELTKKEREFLGDKYRVILFGKNSKSDKEVAEEYNMRLSDYQKLRKGLEYKFYYYLKPLVQTSKKEKGIDFKF